MGSFLAARTAGQSPKITPIPTETLTANIIVEDVITGTNSVFNRIIRSAAKAAIKPINAPANVITTASIKN